MLKKRILSIVLALTMLMVPGAYAAQPAKDDMRGVWVASVHNIDFPSEQGMTADQLKAEADTELDNIAAMGLNTVFLQVRPSADALYPSELFPWSRYVSGTAGQAPDGSFDVLGYWVTAAHERGLQLHAWINPYRITIDGEDEWNAIPDSSPAKQHPEWVIKYNDNYYFDPGIPAVQQLVVDGAAEIVKNYDVDGIHLDETLHTLDKNLSFGVGPAGIWENKSANSKGSNTQGQSSFSELYCDSLQWINAGTVDYICPQLYWSIGFEPADFQTLVKWWQKAVSTSDVALYIGIGAYRSAEAQPGDTWYGTDEIERQLTLLDNSIDIQGEVFFSYASLESIDGCPAFLTAHYAKDKPVTKPDADNSGTITQEEAQRQTTLLDMLSRFIVSLFR